MSTRDVVIPASRHAQATFQPRVFGRKRRLALSPPVWNGRKGNVKTYASGEVILRSNA